MENAIIKSPCVSILIPVYNAEKYIDRCLDSILKQTFGDFEAIVVNDGSKDRTEELILQKVKIDKRIRCITTENKGVAAARQEALRNATGEYVIFVDGDDWIESDMLEDMYDACCTRNVDGTCAGIIHDYSDRRNIKIPVKEEAELEGIDFLKKFYEREFVATLTCYLIKKELWTGFTFPTGISLGEDMAGLVYILSKADKIYAMNRAYYHYCQHDDSLVHSDLTEGKIKAYYYEKDLKRQVLKIIPECREAVETWYVQNQIFLITAMGRAGEYRERIAKEINREFRENFRNNIMSRYLSLPYKISTIMISVNARIYYEVYKLLFNNMKWVYKIIARDV